MAKKEPTYEELTERYVEVRDTLKLFDIKYKERVAGFKKELEELEAAITEKAEADGLEQVKTPVGTAYWSVLANCTAASPDDFLEYVKDNEAWELIQKRPVATAVKAHIAEYGEPPPGVNYSTYRKFNLRATRKGELDDE